MAVNPVFVKDMRSSLFRRKPVLAVALMAVAILVCTLGVATFIPFKMGGNGELPFWRFPDLLLPIIVPAFAAGAFAKEHEQRTWQDLLLTCLTPLEIMRGKFNACIVPTLASIVVMLPPFAMLLILQDVRWGMNSGPWMLIVILKFVISAAFYVAIVLLCSYYSINTRTALVVSYIALGFYGMVNYSLWRFTLTPLFLAQDTIPSLTYPAVNPAGSSLTPSSAWSVSADQFSLSPGEWLHLMQSLILGVAAFLFLCRRVHRARSA